MTPRPGEEKIINFTDRSGKWIDYKYQHTNGKLFQRISRSLNVCRVAKNKWVKNLKEE